ncbi:MAG TPA: hypothetical protein VKQ36_07145 [Ktedonobacterales bacterium]|nr:hypothetical protein [Ktedonobacterales bacterium]
MNNHHSPEGALAPTFTCIRFAPLLAAMDELSEVSELPAAEWRDELAQAREHLASCAWCQREAQAYARLDEVMRHAVGTAALMPLRTEDIMRDILGDASGAPESAARGARETSVKSEAGARPTLLTQERASETDDQDDGLVYSPLLRTETPQREPNTRFRRRMGQISVALASVAAILIVALLAAGVFRAVGLRSSPGAMTQQGIALKGLVNPILTAITFTSPTDGWIAGIADEARSQGQPEKIFFLHEQQGVWTPVYTNISGWDGTRAEILSISMDSPTDGWAAGGEGLLLHYDGHTWRQVKNPPGFPVTYPILYSAVQMLSPTNGWLVGQNDFGSTAIFHYDGRRWSAQAAPASLGAGTLNGVDLLGIDMLPSGEGWVVGELQPYQQATESAPPPPSGLILHYVNGVWSVQAILPGMALRSVSMVSTGAGWAVGNRDVYKAVPNTQGGGYSDEQTPVMVRYSQGKWSPIPDPVATDDPAQDAGLFTHVVMRSPNDGWALGQTDEPLQDREGYAAYATLLFHYDGVRWQYVRLPEVKVKVQNDLFFSYVNAMGLTADGDGWLVGSTTNELDGGALSRLLIYRYHDGAWSVYQS